MAPRSRRYSYGKLRDLIQWSLKDCPGFGRRVEVDGKLNRIDEGIWHDNYWFWLRGPDLPATRTKQTYILRLLEQREDWQRGPEPSERLLREAETLQVLEKSNFPHPTPQFICFVEDDESETIGMIETGLPGYSLERYKDRSTLRLVGRVSKTCDQGARPRLLCSQASVSVPKDGRMNMPQWCVRYPKSPRFRRDDFK
jgi:hypothetical protein